MNNHEIRQTATFCFFVLMWAGFMIYCIYEERKPYVQIHVFQPGELPRDRQPKTRREIKQSKPSSETTQAGRFPRSASKRTLPAKNTR
jgi:hypothetical protein